MRNRPLKLSRFSLPLFRFLISLRCLTVFVLVIILLFGIAQPPPALAHAGLARSLPAAQCYELKECQQNPVLATPPTSLHLWFSEPVQPVRHGIIVIAPSGKQVESGPIQANATELEIALTANEIGTYQVLWQIISEDTHPVRGRFLFSVGEVSQALSDQVSQSNQEFGAVSGLGLLLQVVGRWLHFAGYALAFGGLVGQLWFSRGGLSFSTTATKRFWRLVNMGILALLLAEPCALLGQTASLRVEQIFDPDLIGDMLSSSFGRVQGQHLAAAILLWVLTDFVRQGSRTAELASLGLGLILAVVDGQSSHAVTSGPLLPGLIANTIHVVAMGVWLGGLAVLLVCLDLSNSYSLRQVVGRFSRLALVCLGWLIASGILIAGLHLNQPTDLITTNYGRTLSIKVLTMLGALGLAWAALRRKNQPFWWKMELGGLGLVLTLAGLLVSLPPPA